MVMSGFSCGFKWSNNISPLSMPTCTTYDDAVAQFQEADAKRALLIDENEILLEKFGEEEAERRAKELEGPVLEAEAKEREEQMKLEVSLILEMYCAHVASFL